MIPLGSKVRITDPKSGWKEETGKVTGRSLWQKLYFVRMKESDAPDSEFVSSSDFAFFESELTPLDETAKEGARAC